jgi:hypothetical protein
MVQEKERMEKLREETRESAKECKVSGSYRPGWLRLYLKN